MRATAWIVVVLLVGSCAPKGEPTLDLTVFPKTVPDDRAIEVKVIATKADGKLGTGSVKVTSDFGSLSTPEDVQLDSFGVGKTQLICDPRAEARCGDVRVKASWTSDGVTVTAETRLTPGPIAAGGGSGGGTGGGTGTIAALQPALAACDRTLIVDAITVVGTAGWLGEVDFSISRGLSAGVRMTKIGGQYATHGVLANGPSNVNEVAVWFWPNTAHVAPFVQYDEGNAGQGTVDHFVNFRITTTGPYVVCPSGAGRGSVMFDRVVTAPDEDGGITSGVYLFECPDAGISVRGCFAYK